MPAARPAGVPRPPSADAAEERLIAGGISAALAADVVGEAVVHALPFSAPRNMKRLVRAAFARRIPTPTALGPGPRTIAIVGGGGAGKSSAIAHLAATYAAAGAEVAVIELRGNGSLAHRLQPLGVGVISASGAEQAIERLGAREPLITLIDTPATGPSAKAADVKALAADLKALGAEVHMALPATISAAAAGEVAAALAPLNPSHVALTHTDETSRPGAPLELALAAGRPAVLRLLARRGISGGPRRAGRTAASLIMAAVTAPASQLAVGQHVIVRHLHIGMLPGTVEQVEGTSVVVALAVKDDRIGRTIGQDWAVEATSGRGIFRYPGRLTADRNGSLSIALSGEVERIQRREFVRIEAFLDVTVRGVDEPVGGDTTTVDVSGSGIQIQDKWKLPLGIDVRVELKLPEGPPLRALGRVVRVGQEAEQKGIRMDGIARADEDRLMRYIRDREVQALRAARGR